MSLVPLILLALAQAAPASPTAEPLVGTVADADGTPLADAEVVLASGSSPRGDRPLIGMDLWVADRRAAAIMRNSVLARVLTDAGGHFRIDVPVEILRAQEPTPIALWADRP